MKYTIKGFTLVELIVVITILSILWTIWFLSMQGYSSTARDSVRITDIKTIKLWLELFHLNVWKYPKPTNSTWVTYWTWIVWNQWTFWDSVIVNVSKINRKPVDPLLEVEYTYSVLNTNQEFTLGCSLESWWVALNNTSQVLADGKENWIAYTAWNYNGQLSKVRLWNKIYILALPTIIGSDLSTPTVENLVTYNKLVFKWFSNLPASYIWTKFKIAWSPDVTLVKDVVVYSWSSLPESTLEILEFVTNLKNSYEWTALIENTNYQDIINLDITSNTTSSKKIVKMLWSNIINKNLWWNIIESALDLEQTPPEWEIAVPMNSTDELITVSINSLETWIRYRISWDVVEIYEWELSWWNQVTIWWWLVFYQYPEFDIESVIPQA